MTKNQKIIHKFLVKELKTLPHADLIEEGVLDRMGARVAGAWSKGISGDESRSIAKKVQRIINTHRVEMESDFAKLDITDTAAVEQVLDAMRKMENAAKQYLGGEKERSGGYVTKQGDAAPPIDTDGDGKPDAQDIDGDGEPEVFDTDGCYSSSRFTPDVAGKYMISGAAIWNTNTSYDGLSMGRIFVYKNGSEIYRNHFDPRNSSQDIISSFNYISVAVEMNGTSDYVELYGYVDVLNSGISDFWQTGSYFSAYRLIT